MRLLTDIIFQGRKNFSKRRALAKRPLYRTITWTYDDLANNAAGFAGFLEKNNVKKGDRVIIWAANSPQWLAAFFGCLLRGAIAVPLHTENTQDFITKVIAQTEPKMFFKSSELKAKEELSQYPWIDIDILDVGDRIPYINVGDRIPYIGEKDVAEILYTSGTTGEPKGVILTHKNIVSNLHSIWDVIPIGKHDRVLSILPLSHIFEQIVEFRVLAAGGFLVYAPALSSNVITELLQKYQITKIAAVPEFLQRIIQRVESKAAMLFAISSSLPSFLPAGRQAWRRIIFWPVLRRFGGKLGLVVSGGAPLAPDVARKWALMGVDIIQGYGLTETSPVVAALRSGEGHLNSVGRVVKDVEVKISGQGEILVRGPSVTQGYWRNKEQTRERFTENGWLKTGDQGYFDKQGYLYISGRKKFMILTASGQNVFPEDIERELNKESEVEDSAVVGLEKDGRTLIHAVLLRHVGSETSYIGNVISRVNGRLASFQQIQEWSVWPFNDFPRTITRKVKRYEVLAYLRRGRSREKAEVRKEETSAVAGIIAEVLGVSAGSLSDDTKIVSLGLDSLSRIELVARIEEDLGVAVDEAWITPHITLKDLEKIIQEKPQVPPPRALPSWPRHTLIRFLRKVIFAALVLPLTKIFVRLRVEGLEHLEDLRLPVIFMPNHRSDLDGLLVQAALPGRLRRRTALAAAEDVLYEQFWWAAPIVTFLFNIYPFSRRRHPRIGLQYTGEMLDQGWSIVYFPEGGIPESREEEWQLKQGTGVVAVEMEAAIVPVRIEGAQEIMPRGRHLPRKRGTIGVIFGPPLYFAKDMDYNKAKEKILEALQKIELN